MPPQTICSASRGILFGTTNATNTFPYGTLKAESRVVTYRTLKKECRAQTTLVLAIGHPKRPSGYPNSTYMAIRSSVLAIRSSDRPPTWSSGHPNVTYMWSSGHPAIHLATYMVIRSSTWPSTLGDLFELLCAYNEPRADLTEQLEKLCDEKSKHSVIWSDPTKLFEVLND